MTPLGALWHGLVCVLVGLLATGLPVGLLHLWVRLWQRILIGQWTFDSGGEACTMHYVVIVLSILAFFVLFLIYLLGCYARGLLGV